MRDVAPAPIAPAEIPLRPQDEVECRRCEVHCDRVVLPAACIARDCPFVYAYEAWGHTYMDAGFYSADYLRAWIRSAQVRAHLRREVGRDWWRLEGTGELLRGLFREGTRPTTEEIAGRIGYDPLDTAPLVAETTSAT